MQRSRVIFFLILPSIIHAACPSFNIIYPPMRTLLCPGDNITYTCTFNSSSPIVITQWTGSGFQCSNPGVAANTIQLTQSSSGSLNTVPGSCGNLSAVMTNINGTCYTSVLTIPTPQYFNGTTVTCRDGFTGTLIGNDTLNIQLAFPPSAPTITSLINTYSDRLTVTWTSVPTATRYNVSINDSVNTLVPIPSTGAQQYNFTGLTNNTVYTVSVVAINCAGSSSPAKMTGRTGDQIGNGPTVAPPIPSTATPTPSTTTYSRYACSPPMLTAVDTCTCTAAVGSAIGTAVGVSVPVTFVVSFSMGVLVASVLCYISRRSKESSHKPSSHADFATVYDEVGSHKKMKGDAMEMNTNTAYGSRASENKKNDLHDVFRL